MRRIDYSGEISENILNNIYRSPISSTIDKLKRKLREFVRFGATSLKNGYCVPRFGSHLTV